MPAAQDLINDALEFMDNNIVAIQWDGNAGHVDRTITKGTRQLWLHRPAATSVVGRRKNWRKSALPVYYLIPTINPLTAAYTVDPTPITVYFCPYRNDLTLGTIISNAADLMFTTQMDGCSLGVGSRTASGSRLVYHCNHAAGMTGPDEQTNAQDTDLRGAFGAAKQKHRLIAGVVSPVDYRLSRRGNHYNSTTFGVRDAANNNWAFYSQRYAITLNSQPKEYVFKEVKRVF